MRALAVVAERLHAAGLWRRLAELPDDHCIGRASGRNFLGEEILDRLLSVVFLCRSADVAVRQQTVISSPSGLSGTGGAVRSVSEH